MQEIWSIVYVPREQSCPHRNSSLAGNRLLPERTPTFHSPSTTGARDKMRQRHPLRWCERELREAIKEMDQDEITEKLRQRQIDWKFNPPAASHMGGVWERQIRTARKILGTLLQEHGGRLDDESLRTLMCEVESIMNSRPLTVTSSDYKDPVPLSPNQILTMKTSIVLPPPGKFQRNDVYMRRRWRRVQYLCNLFWSRWRKEYLPTLQERPKWNQVKRNLQINDIVLLRMRMRHGMNGQWAWSLQCNQTRMVSSGASKYEQPKQNCGDQFTS